ncbi:MAG TPA: GxxExxY protein [Caulobacteraceae bacterium]
MGEEDRLCEAVLGCALTVHKVLGPGLLERVYERCLAHELGTAGIKFERQILLPVIYDGLGIDEAYRIDLLIARHIVVEVKAVDRVVGVHRAQLLSYMKLGGFSLGYLLNFNSALMKDGIVRLRNGFPREAP